MFSKQKPKLYQPVTKNLLKILKIFNNQTNHGEMRSTLLGAKTTVLENSIL